MTASKLMSQSRIKRRIYSLVIYLTLSAYLIYCRKPYLIVLMCTSTSPDVLLDVSSLSWFNRHLSAAFHISADSFLGLTGGRGLAVTRLTSNPGVVSSIPRRTSLSDET